MRLLPFTCCVFVLCHATAFAEAPTMCELRIGGSFAAGGSLGLALAESNIPYVDTTRGRSWSAEFLGPVTPGLGVRIDAARGGMNARRDDRDVSARHLTVGILHALRGRDRPCGYAGGGIGLYEFSSAGQRARTSGVFGLFGVEGGVGERSGIAFEVQLHLAQNSRTALKSDVVLMLRPSVLFRVHF